MFQRPQRRSGARDGTNTERKMKWLTKPAHRKHLSPARRVHRTPAPAALVPHALQALADLEAREVDQEDGSSSVARRSASSAPRRSTPSATATYACCRALLRSGARLCRAV